MACENEKDAFETCDVRASGPGLGSVMGFFFFLPSIPLAFLGVCLASYVCGSPFHTLPPKYKYYLGLKREQEGAGATKVLPPLLSVSLAGPFQAGDTPSSCGFHSKARPPPEVGRDVTADLSV